MYIQYKAKLDNEDLEEKADEILHIKRYLINNKVKCFKYNYSLES